MVVIGWCCLLFCVARCLLLFDCLVGLCDNVACRLFVVGVVHPSCLWCVGEVVSVVVGVRCLSCNGAA